MRELNQIRTAVIEALNAGGIPALAAFPAGRARQYQGPVAAVSVGRAEGRTLGFCNYLGEVYDEAAGTVQERYGKLMEAEILVDLWAQQAAACDSGCETAAEVLLGGLPEGIRPGELKWEELKWEKAQEMFLRRGKLRCQAAFLANGQEDQTAFLDFRLKGVLET